MQSCQLDFTPTVSKPPYHHSPGTNTTNHERVNHYTITKTFGINHQVDGQKFELVQPITPAEVLEGQQLDFVHPIPPGADVLVQMAVTISWLRMVSHGRKW